MNILVTGGGSGLGAAIVRALMDNHCVVTYDRDEGYDVRKPDISVLRAFPDGALDVLINCAGVNLIDWLPNFPEDKWDEVMDVNAKGIFLMSQAFLNPLIDSKGTILNIVSNASHMPMTASLAYNASKGAAHIMTLQMARELTKEYGITVFGISPNKLAGTNMSAKIEVQVERVRGWTATYAAEYQRNALLTGAETPPDVLADFIAYLFQHREHHRYLSGCVLPYGA